MKLRVIEINAIIQKVKNSIENNLVIPNFDKELNEYKKSYNKILELSNIIDRAKNEIQIISSNKNLRHIGYI